MSQVIMATFEDGILKPDQKLDLPPRARVRLTIETLGDAATSDSDRDWEELEKLWEESSIDSGGFRMTRDQLHERD